MRWLRCSLLPCLLALSQLTGAAALGESVSRAHSRMHLRSGMRQDGEPAPAPAGAPGPAPQAAVTTKLSAEAPAGATTLEVESSEGFGVGDTVIVGNETDGEQKAIIGFGSIILDSALEKAYPAGTVVTLAGVMQPPPSTTLVATAAKDPVAETVAEMDEMVKAEKEVLSPTDPLALLKQQLSANEWLQDELEEKQDSLKEEVYRAKLANDVEAVAKETTPGVAQMLGDMRRQMHALAAPFYVRAIDGQLKDLKDREKTLLKEIEEKESGSTTTTAPVKREETFEMKAKEPEPVQRGSEDERTRLYVICGIAILGMLAMCGLLAMRRRR
eukprot:TRINITY_DN111572_c0_g1_i1.p1 TRINITY_DN111572_c0_g1~~TRINITY_DN111572_c0_g1_i1.p1  ORF type:complete len:329 (+),score=112.87 TRINITY_DN111572_c0_g1_i1:116-1102(+)